MYTLMGLSQLAVEGRKVGVTDPETNIFAVKATFSTLTNVDFDPERFVALIHEGAQRRDQLKQAVQGAGGNIDFAGNAVSFTPKSTVDELVEQGKDVGLHSYPAENPDILSLKHTVLFGMKGVSAYADHAQILGQEDDSVYAFVHEGLAAIQRDDLSLDDWVGLALRCGEAAVKAMALLDAGNTGVFGHPVPTKVPLGQKRKGHSGFRA